MKPVDSARTYRLTPRGIRALRAAARRVRPWERSTGPRSEIGKNRSKMNAYKHGLRSAEALALKRLARATIQELRGFDKA
jgi:DNA-binding PadR family transcriptional regulator